jgi:hypothetical protein
MTNAFLAKYRDPRWQRLRLKVMEEAGFQCQACYDETETLNVHHKLYRKDANPWDYELEELICLCHNCHQYIHEQKNRLNTAIANSDWNLLDYLVGYAEASNCDGPEGKIHISSTTMASGVADYFGIEPDEVMVICVDDYVTLYDLNLTSKKKPK